MLARQGISLDRVTFGSKVLESAPMNLKRLALTVIVFLLCQQAGALFAAVNHAAVNMRETVIEFGNNANYSIETKLLFEPPQFDKKVLHHIYNTNNTLLEKLKKGLSLTPNEIADLNNLSATYLICYLNDFESAIEKLEEAKPLLKSYSKSIYEVYKLTMRILRKVKYN